MIVFIILVPVLIYFLVPYFKVNSLTAKYGAEFSSLYSENGFYEDIEYLKVFQYRDEKVDMVYLDDDRLKKGIG